MDLKLLSTNCNTVQRGYVKSKMYSIIQLRQLQLSGERRDQSNQEILQSLSFQYALSLFVLLGNAFANVIIILLNYDCLSVVLAMDGRLISQTLMR
ncbi:hypothetical protein RJ639_001366 [Escallonia herrerae]|uniref:Uncharacterized protein n=1 Tax=Escallonia herrerae TaxID=1293975 RepID=A0AA89BF07_9ASTE|nr:hypothetical protein RJ639_001366 [Escallonia herrerae]